MDIQMPEGRYKILRKLGEGAYGEVFLAEHTGLGVQRAVKRIQKNRDRLQTGRNEVDILKNLNYPGLPTIYDAWEDDEFFYFAEEYIEGVTLEEFVLKRSKLTQAQAVTYAISICRTLEYMQKKGGICHLDLKPENIIISENEAKLLDFGSGIYAGRAVRHITGTKGYAAPEMYHTQGVDGACDIYSLGVIMVFMLTGERNGTGSLKCSEFLKSIIFKCMSHNKCERYDSPSDLLTELTKFQNKAEKNCSITINVYGVSSKAGTTHAAIMLSSYFKGKGMRCALYCGKREDRVPLYFSNRKVVFDGGAYIVDGMQVIPDYDGAAVCTAVDTDVNIVDRGVFSVEKWKKEHQSRERQYNKESMTSDTVSDNTSDGVRETVDIIIMGHTFWETMKYSEVRRMLAACSVQGQVMTGVNFASGAEYGRIVRQLEIKNAFRIPYCTAPYDFKGDGSFDKLFRMDKKRFGDGWRCRAAGGKHAFMHLHSELSVKCGKEKNDSARHDA